MRIYVDATEPGIVFHDVARRGAADKFHVERSLLHKREGLGGSARENHPFYGLGADFVITDASKVPVAAIERKTLDDLAKSAGIVDRRAPEGTKLFRQLRDLLSHPMPVLILEGAPTMLYRRVEPALVGLQLWCAREGISIIYTTGPLASSHAVVLLARRLSREMASLLIDERVAFLGQQRAARDPAPPSVSNDPRTPEAAPADEFR